MSEFGCLKEGYLIKQGRNVKSWRKRFFLLQTNVLYYFRTDKDTVSKGFVLFKDIVRIDERHTDSHPNIIAIVCKSRILLLSIDNVVEASSWAQVLRTVFRFYSCQLSYSSCSYTEEAPIEKAMDISLGNVVPSAFSASGSPAPLEPHLSSSSSTLISPLPSSSSSSSSSFTSSGASQNDISQASLRSSSAPISDFSKPPPPSTSPILAPVPLPGDNNNGSNNVLNNSGENSGTSSCNNSNGLAAHAAGGACSSVWCYSDEYLRTLFDFGRKTLDLIVQANGYIRSISVVRKDDQLRGSAMMLGSLGTRLAAGLIDLIKAPFSTAKKIEICRVCGDIVTMNETVRQVIGEARLLKTCLNKMEEYLRMIVAVNPPLPQDEIRLAVQKAMIAAESIVPDKKKSKEVLAQLGVPKKRAVGTLKRMVDGGNGLLWIGNRFSAVCEGVATSFLPDPATEKTTDTASKAEVDVSFMQDMKQLMQLAKEAYSTFIVLGNAVMQSKVVKDAGSNSFNPLDLINDPYVAQSKERFIAYLDAVLDIGTRNFIRKA